MDKYSCTTEQFDAGMDAEAHKLDLADSRFISYLPIDVGFDLRVHPTMGVNLQSHADAASIVWIRYMDGEDIKHYRGPIAKAYLRMHDAGYAIPLGAADAARWESE